MSIRVMTRVWDCPQVGGGSELLALLALADWSDDEGRCWPAMEKIAKKIRLSEKQTRRVVHALIDAGLIEVIGNHKGGRKGMDGDGYSRQYRVVIERLSTLPLAGGLGAADEKASTLPPVSSTLPPVSLLPSHGREATRHRTTNRTVKNISPSADAQGNRLPDWLNVDLWENFIGHCEDLGKPLTPAGQVAALAELERLRADGNDPDTVLEQAILGRGILLPVIHHGHTATT